MRLTNFLLEYAYPKPYYFGFGHLKYLKKKVRDVRHKVWNGALRLKENKVYVYDQLPIPEEKPVIEANELVLDSAGKAELYAHRATAPWPFEVKPEEGTREDPRYKAEPALTFSRRSFILEGFKGAASFSNTLIESHDQLPDVVKNLEENFAIPSNFLELLDRRLQWSRETDGTLLKLPRIPDFPKVNFKLPRKYGIPTPRKELHTLSTYHDIMSMLCYHNSTPIDRRKIYSPKCNIGFYRENKVILCDLQCDFVTTTTAAAAVAVSDKVPLGLPAFCETPQATAEKPLESIHPCNWEICFEEDHFYEEKLGYKMPAPYTVHTIFLGTGYNHVKKVVDRYVKGQMLMFCYGYATAQARLLHGDFKDYKNIVNYQEIPKPLTVQCVFINESKSAMYFACFQLNTTSFTSDLKNQVWFEGPYDFLQDKEKILRKMSAMHQLGSTNNIQREEIKQRVNLV